jgi:protoporphyrinogen/coproporphyrinogen III oxidase
LTRMSTPVDVDIVIVGAGISGLAAAYELRKRKTSVLVLEKSDRPGGVIQTERVGEFIVDEGPDSLLVQKPAAVALCNEIGLGDRLIPTKAPRTAYILRGGRLHSLPGASVLGFPTRIRPLLRSSLFSVQAKARMGAELFIPRRRGGGDESIASFVQRRFGSEAVRYIAEPLLAGIHAGDVERLSMRALFPRFVEAESANGSVIRALRKTAGPRNADGAFRSFPGGIAEIVEGLMRAVPKESVRLNSTVTRVEAIEDGFTVHLEDRPPIRAGGVILACPAFSTADLLRAVDAQLADLCGSIKYLSTATVVLGFPREAIHHKLAGTGFVVPRSEGLNITAGAWISSKWPHRAPPGYALLRAFLGGARDPDVLAKSDRELSETALNELGKVLGIRGAPTLTRVYRWNRASPQQEVGHLDLVAKIDALLARHPGLFVSAAGFRGVGIPDCVADARAIAGIAAEYVKRH